MVTVRSQLETNLLSITARIDSAAVRAGRKASDVTLVAVTKYARIEWVQELVALGQTNLGENRPQQLWERAAVLPSEIQWHLIGHLQSNKAKRILPLVKWIHSIDSIKLLTSLDRFASEAGLRPRLLVEVNVTGEVSKDGFVPEELRRDWDLACQFQNIELCGLMTMAAPGTDSNDARPAFAMLRGLRDELQARSPDHVKLNHLSMGMTGDFEVAIEEGATLIRIGSAIFEGLE